MKFKIEFNQSMMLYKYEIYRKEKLFIIFPAWRLVASYETLNEAEEAMNTLKLFPKYYSI